MRKYCNNRWQVRDDELYESYGCILLQNTENNQIDIVRISTQGSLRANHTTYKKNKSFYQGTRLSAKFQTDA
jgi:hypothetical protein